MVAQTLGKRVFAVFQGVFHHVDAPENQHIEDAVDHWVGASIQASPAGLCVDAVEIGSSKSVEHADFSIQHGSSWHAR